MSEKFTQGHALLIGVNLQGVPTLEPYQLPGVAKDVQQVQRVLVNPQRCAYIPENVQVLLGDQSTKDNIRKEMRVLAERVSRASAEESTVIIYFSGHGFVTEINGENRFYLIPYDADNSDSDELDATALRDTDFVRYVEKIQAARVVILLDCCHAGASMAKGGGAKPLPKIGEAITKGTPGSGSDIRVGSQLYQLAWGEGRAVLMSSKDKEQSYMMKDGSMSIFTAQLIDGLSGHGLHTPDATTVNVMDVINHVIRKVPQLAREDQGRSQTPQLRYEGGDFPLALLIGGKGLGGAPAPKLEETVDLIEGKGDTTNVNSHNVITNNKIGKITGDNNKIAQGQKSDGDMTINF